MNLHFGFDTYKLKKRKSKSLYVKFFFRELHGSIGLYKTKIIKKTESLIIDKRYSAKDTTIETSAFVRGKITPELLFGNSLSLSGKINVNLNNTMFEDTSYISITPNIHYNLTKFKNANYSISLHGGTLTYNNDLIHLDALTRVTKWRYLVKDIGITIALTSK